MQVILNWQFIAFNSLTNVQLYNILKLRNLVFIVEQNCVYNDLDDKDEPSTHVLGTVNNELAAYCRLLPPNISYPNYCSIGRVLTHANFRTLGLGKILMEKAIQQCQTLWPNVGIKIGAQNYLLNFYQNLGFKVSGPIYLEDGIEHIEMEYTKI
jgi:ElaA protein